MSWLILGLILVYFFSGAHSKVLAHFGLSERDDKLMFMGYCLFGSVMFIGTTILALVTGAAFTMPLIISLIFVVGVVLNYKRL